MWDDDDGDGDCGDAGKVHGSLARAGKVRGQTPKVAKQDKKKKPTGRAHKRMQYNCCFVTAGIRKEVPNFLSGLFVFWHLDCVDGFCYSKQFFYVFCSCWIWQKERPKLLREVKWLRHLHHPPSQSRHCPSHHDCNVGFIFV